MTWLEINMVLQVTLMLTIASDFLPWSQNNKLFNFDSNLQCIQLAWIGIGKKPEKKTKRTFI